MAHSKHSFITICLVPVLMSASFGQVITRPKEYAKESRRSVLHYAFTAKAKSAARAFLFANYFVSENIYPNADAIDLMGEINDDLDLSDTTIRKFTLVDIPDQFREKINSDESLGVQPDSLLNESLRKDIKVFNERYVAVQALITLSTGFKDSLGAFKSNTLPWLSDHAALTGRTQISFFDIELKDINDLIAALPETMPGNSSASSAIIEMMKDFITFKALHATSTGYGKELDNQAPAAPFFASYHPGIQHESPPVEELPNANIYVYVKSQGNRWYGLPEKDAFQVFYGANGLKYSLTPGCDTLSYFKYRPATPASVLPVVLAKGSYAFVFQDLQTKELYLKTDINLRDNKVIDDKLLIKLCFKIEN